jgi:hypothetical protein
VDDERVGGGAAFGLVDEVDGARVGGVCAQAVDGFGGEGDEAAPFQELDGLVNLVHSISLASVWQCCVRCGLRRNSTGRKRKIR